MSKRPSRVNPSSSKPEPLHLAGATESQSQQPNVDAPIGVTAPGAVAPSATHGAPGGAFPLIDRRLGLDRRAMSANADPSGLERRRGPGRRRTDFLKAADEGEMNREQFLFLMAIDAFKKSNSRMFPTWSDVLEVIRLLGYRKTMPSELNLRSAEDWTEPASAPANVKSIQSRREAA